MNAQIVAMNATKNHIHAMLKDVNANLVLAVNVRWNIQRKDNGK